MALSLKSIRPKRFNLIDPARTIANIRRGQQRYLEDVVKQLNEGYDRATPSKRYIRTNAVRNGWIINVSADGSVATLTNSAGHAVFPVGPRGGGRQKGSRQAAFQRKRGWRSISDVARATVPKYKQLMNRAISPSRTQI